MGDLVIYIRDTGSTPKIFMPAGCNMDVLLSNFGFVGSLKCENIGVCKLQVSGIKCIYSTALTNKEKLTTSKLEFIYIKYFLVWFDLQPVPTSCNLQSAVYTLQ